MANGLGAEGYNDGAERANRLPLPPEFDPAERLRPAELRLGMEVVAHRVVVNLDTGEEQRVPSRLVRGAITRIYSEPRSDRRQFVVGRRPDGEPDYILPSHDYRDSELFPLGQNNIGPFACRFAFFNAEALPAPEAA